MSKKKRIRGIKGWAATATVVGVAIVSGLAHDVGAEGGTDRASALLTARRTPRSGGVLASLDRRSGATATPPGGVERRVAPDLRKAIAPAQLDRDVAHVVNNLGGNAQRSIYQAVVAAGPKVRRALIQNVAYLLGQRIQHFGTGPGRSRVILEGAAADRENWFGAERLVDALGVGVLEQATFRAVISTHLQRMLNETERTVAAGAARGVEEGDHGGVEPPLFAAHTVPSGDAVASEADQLAKILAPQLLDHVMPSTGAHWWQSILPSAAPRDAFDVHRNGGFADGDIF